MPEPKSEKRVETSASHEAIETVVFLTASEFPVRVSSIRDEHATQDSTAPTGQGEPNADVNESE